MAEDDSEAIFVDVVPRLDEDAADEAESKLKDRFKDVGKNITESLGKVGHEAADKIADQLKSHGHSIGESLSTDIFDGLGDKIGGHLGSVLGDGIGDIFEGHMPDLSGMTDVFGDMFDSIRNAGSDLGDVFGDLKSGNVSDGLGGLSEALKNIHGVNLDGLGDITGNLDKLTGSLSKISDLFNGATNISGLDDASDFVNMLADSFGNNSHMGWTKGAATGLNFLSNEANQFQNPDNADNLVHGFGGTAWEILKNAGMGAAGGAMVGSEIPILGNAVGAIAGATVGAGAGLSHTEVGKTAYDTVFGPYDNGSQTATAMSGVPTQSRGVSAADQLLTNASSATSMFPSSVPSSNPAAHFLGGTTASMGAPSSVTTSTMGVTAGSVTVTGGVSIPNISVGGSSAGSMSSMPGVHSGGGSASHVPVQGPGIPHPTAVTGSGNANGHILGLPKSMQHRSMGGVIHGYSGGGEIGGDEGVGIGIGGSPGVLPGNSPGYDNMLGRLPSGQMVGLEGGEGVINPAAMSQPGVPDLLAHLNGHYDEGGIIPGMPTPEPPPAPKGPAPGPGKGGPKEEEQGGPKGPNPKGGKPEDENVVGGAKKPAKPQTTTPHGTGAGFKITGGGLIGFAEQLPGMAAQGAGGMFPGAGAAGAAAAAAMQIGIQEANRAASYAGQVAGILAIEAPLNTFSVRGNKGSNLAKSLPGKLAMGIVGNHNFSENMAGTTTPPLQPTKDEANPVGGGNPKGQQPGINIENMHVGNKGQGAEMEQTMNRTANQYTAAYPA